MSSTPRLPLELFAIDGMLTEEERAIRDVVRDFVERRIKPEVAAITASAMRGEIDFVQSLRQRVRLCRHQSPTQ